MAHMLTSCSSGQSVPNINEEIEKQENSLVKQTRGKIIDGFPGRSDYGTKGKQIALLTNSFKITTAYEANAANGNDQLYRYEIDIFPDPKSRPKRRRFLEQLLLDQKFNSVHWATDYSSIIVTTKKLDLGDRSDWEKNITLSPPSDNSQQPQGPLPPFVQDAQQRNTATLQVAYKHSYALRDIIDYRLSDSSGAQYVRAEELIQMLNIIISKPPQASRTVTNVGRNKFYPFHGDALAQIFELGGGLQALRGYFSSVRPAVGRLLLNINVTSGAFYKPMAFIEMMRSTEGNLSEREAFIHKLRVTATYKRDGENKPFMTKTKTIVGFSKELDKPTFRVKRFGNAKEVTFKYRSSRTAPVQNITVFDYFKNHYNITLQRHGLPVLNVGTREDPQYLPPELCEIPPGQAYRKLLPEQQTAAMITFAARPPNANAMSIAGTQGNPGHGFLLFRLASPAGQHDPQPTSVQPFGIRVGTNMLTVPGRILESPRVMYRGTQNACVDRASWNLQNVQFRNPGRFDAWQVIMLDVRRLNGSIMTPLTETPDGDMLAPKQLIRLFAQSMARYGIQLGQQGQTRQVALAPLTKENRRTNDNTIADFFAKSKEKGKKKVFLIILPSQERWLYARIKYYGDVKYGIHTINAIGNKIQKPRGQSMFMGNLALKFNIKGGGVSHNVAETLVGPVGNNTILFGIDVTHPSPSSKEGAPSIACVVANTNSTLFNWPGSIRTQTGREEMVDGLRDMVLERLNTWRKHNDGRLPDRVVIYRDGVSEGQFKTVLERELPYFEEAYALKYGDKPKWPKTAIIICGKRHHVRFYPTTPEDADVDPNSGKGSWNTLPGTVVDRGIVGRVIREFYLQAHQGLQGTVKPCHYSVIKDDIGFTADQLERFTLNLCYYFARCTKAVSVCPPAYYADILAERGRAYLFSTLQENHADDASSIAGDDWTGGVHPDVADSTWYI